MNFLEKIQQKKIAKMEKEFNSSGILRYFHFDYGCMADGMTGYTIEEKDGAAVFTHQKYSMTDGHDESRAIYMPLSIMQRIKQLLREEKLYLWNGFNKSNSVIATGESFTLEAAFDRYRLKAYGMVMMPPVYKEKSEILISFLDGLIEEFGEE